MVNQVKPRGYFFIIEAYVTPSVSNIFFFDEVGLWQLHKQMLVEKVMQIHTSYPVKKLIFRWHDIHKDTADFTILHHALYYLFWESQYQVTFGPKFFLDKTLSWFTKKTKVNFDMYLQTTAMNIDKDCIVVVICVFHVTIGKPIEHMALGE